MGFNYQIIYELNVFFKLEDFSFYNQYFLEIIFYYKAITLK